VILSANLEPLQPGGEPKRNVVFDVPTNRVAIALNYGALVVVDFGSTVSTATTAALLKLF
jgi:pantothenate kinase type III